MSAPYNTYARSHVCILLGSSHEVYLDINWTIQLTEAQEDAASNRWERST